jgi:hypothetical protein
LLITNLELPSAQDEFATINIHYYKNGAEVLLNKFSLFSIINGGSTSYDAISFSTTITNNGQVPFQDMKITSLNIESADLTNRGYITWNSPAGTPVYTNGNYYQTIGNVAVGESKIITSQQYEVATLEQFAQPISFYIKGTAMNTYTGNTTSFNSSKVSLTIEAEAKTYTSDGVSYLFLKSWNNPTNFFDNNWNTYTSLNPSSVIIINYTKQSGVIGANLNIKLTTENTGDYGQDIITENISIPIECWNYNVNKLSIKIYRAYPAGHSYYLMCYDGSRMDSTDIELRGWKQIKWYNIPLTNLQPQLYESKMLWNKPTYNLIYQSTPDVSSGNYERGEFYFNKPDNAIDSSTRIQLGIIDKTNYTSVLCLSGTNQLKLKIDFNSGYCSGCCPGGYSGSFRSYTWSCYDSATSSWVSMFAQGNNCNSAITPSASIYWNVTSS